MKSILTALDETPIIYVTRDAERAAGFDIYPRNYFIISNASPFAKNLPIDRTQLLLIDAGRPIDTWELLEHPLARTFIDGIKNSRLLVFKPSKKIERIAEKHQWKLLNPKAALAGNIEEKLTQLSFLEELRDLFPPFKTGTCASFSDLPYPFVLQFNHSHTGLGTHLIARPEDLQALREKFPKRDARAARFIDGPIFTNNNIVTPSQILVGNISYQITGIRPFTDNSFATVGNDWTVPETLLSQEDAKTYTALATRVGEALKTRGWKGLFGIDVIKDNASGRLFLLEINARQPQSATFESHLQHGARKNPEDVTTFEAHLAALLGMDIGNSSLIHIHRGARIIDRRTNIWHENDTSFMRTLSAPAMTAVNAYLYLSLGGKHISCPYINNRRQKIRGALRVMIGKGSPEDIVEEARIIAIKNEIELTNLTEPALKQFLVDEHLGIECSGLVYHVLRAEVAARGGTPLERQLAFPFAKNALRRMLARMRPAENTNVKTIAHPDNSQEAPLSDVRPGDIIVLLGAGEKHDRDHVMIISEIVWNEKGLPVLLRYVHSFRWRTDGQYGHGARSGTIRIGDTAAPLLFGEWVEQEKTGSENETFAHAKTAREISIRRLKALA